MPTSNGTSLEALEPLVGEWTIQHWEVPLPEAPDGIAIIGLDPESEGNYLQHDFDLTYEKKGA